MLVFVIAVLQVASSFGQQVYSVQTIDQAITDFSDIAPLYLRLTGNDNFVGVVDSVCYTFYQLPDNSNTYLVYQSAVYLNRTNIITSFITEKVADGVVSQGTDDLVQNIYTVGTSGCNIVGYVIRTCPGRQQYAIALSPLYTRISPAEVQQSVAIVQAQGLPVSDSGGLYVLPMNYPPRCVYQQGCPALPSPFYPYYQ